MVLCLFLYGVFVIVFFGFVCFLHVFFFFFNSFLCFVLLVALGQQRPFSAGGVVSLLIFWKAGKPGAEVKYKSLCILKRIKQKKEQNILQNATNQTLQKKQESSGWGVKQKHSKI